MKHKNQLLKKEDRIKQYNHVSQIGQKQYKFSVATVLYQTFDVIKYKTILSMSADSRNCLDLVLNCLTV